MDFQRLVDLGEPFGAVGRTAAAALFLAGDSTPVFVGSALTNFGVRPFLDTFLPLANKENDFLIDRDMQRNDNFSGIWGANEQDRALQEGMRSVGRKHPGIVDRSKEHLMASDLAVVTARNKLLKMASDLEKGIEPACAQSGKSFAVRSITKICDEDDFDAFVETFKDEIKAPSAR